MKTDTIRRMILFAIPAGLAGGWALSRDETTIPVVAKRFVFIPDTITVQVGHPVLLRITAPEVPMGLSIPDFQVRTTVAPGREAMLRFTPDRPGSFTFLCDVFCGDGHENMNGTLVVRA